MPEQKPNPGQTKKPAQKKKLTRQQRYQRFAMMQMGLFFTAGILAGLLLVGFFSLITLPFSHHSDSSAASSETLSHSEQEAEDSAFGSSEDSALDAITIRETSSEVTLLAVGDNLIHDTVIDYGLQADGSYDFTEIYSYLADEISAADIACIQQETIFVSDPAEYSNYPLFGTPAEMAQSLADVGFDVVCHASNHTADKGDTGITDTLAAWAKIPSVTVLGIHDSQEDADTISVVEKNGISIAMLDYTYGLNGCTVSQDYMIDMLTEENKDHIAQQIEEARELSDIVVVFMHDGIEDDFSPCEEQEQWCQFFADEGVGLVIGTHPHVIEPIESMTNCDGIEMPIFYSLGNFVSSQSDAINMVGAMAKVTITKDGDGTRVTDYYAEPTVNWISLDGTYGYGYAFHTLHLEDYTDDMAARHIRSGCSVSALWDIWYDVFPDYVRRDAEDADEPEASALDAA